MINQRSYIPVVPSKTIPDSRPKWAKSTPVFRPKRHKKNPSFWRGTYPYNVRKGVPSPSPPPPLPGRENTRLHEHHTVFYISSTSLHVTTGASNRSLTTWIQLPTKTHVFKDDVNKKPWFFFLILRRGYSPFEFNSRNIRRSLTRWKNPGWTLAMKFETERIYFLEVPLFKLQSQWWLLKLPTQFSYFSNNFSTAVECNNKLAYSYLYLVYILYCLPLSRRLLFPLLHAWDVCAQATYWRAS